MSSFDLFLLIPLGIGAFNGYRKGLLIEIFGIVGFVAAIIIGFKFLHLGAAFLSNSPGMENISLLSPYISFFVVFLPSLFIIRQIGRLMKRAIRLTFLGTLDGILGAALGTVTAALAISILLWIVNKTGITLPTEDSMLYGYLEDFAPKTFAFISDLLPGGSRIEYFERLKSKTV